MLGETQQLHYAALKILTALWIIPPSPPLPLLSLSTICNFENHMLHDAGFHHMLLSCQMLVNCFASRKRKRKEWSSDETRLERGRKTDVRNQRDPCCHVWMQHWLCRKRRKGKREGDRGRVVSFWLCCAVQSGLGALLTVLDWWIELCIAHNINFVPLSLSFWVAFPHHSSLPFHSPALPLSLPLSLPTVTASGPSLVPPFHISFYKASLMLPESALWGSKKARWADCYPCDSFSAWQAAHKPGNWTGLCCFVEEVGEEVEKQEEELRGKLDRWRTAPNTWDTAWLTWRSWAPTLKEWPLPVSWLQYVVCLSVS